MKRLFVALLLVAGLTVPITGSVSALNTCSSMVVYETGYARCTAGTTGAVRVWITCRVPGSAQNYYLTGPRVGRGVWSIRSCPWPMVITGAGYAREA